LTSWRKWLADIAAATRQRALKAQRDDPRTQLMQVCIRLDEARRYVDRDRAAERRHVDMLMQKIRKGRELAADMEELIRASMQGQSLLQAELALRQTQEALASDFGGLAED
jgi:hypothetical protein